MLTSSGNKFKVGRTGLYLSSFPLVMFLPSNTGSFILNSDSFFVQEDPSFIFFFFKGSLYDLADEVITILLNS